VQRGIHPSPRKRGRRGSGSCQDDEAHEEDEAECLPQANKRIHTQRRLRNSLTHTCPRSPILTPTIIHTHIHTTRCSSRRNRLLFAVAFCIYLLLFSLTLSVAVCVSQTRPNFTCVCLLVCVCVSAYVRVGGSCISQQTDLIPDFRFAFALLYLIIIFIIYLQKAQLVYF